MFIIQKLLSVTFHFIGSQKMLLLQDDEFYLFLGFHSNDRHALKFNFKKTTYNKI